MRIPRCIKTVTGKHSFSRDTCGREISNPGFICHGNESHEHRLSCRYCGIIDDRKPLGSNLPTKQSTRPQTPK